MTVRPTIDLSRHEAINRQVEEFLAKGGTITVVPGSPNLFPEDPKKEDKAYAKRTFPASFSFHPTSAHRTSSSGD